MKKIILPILTLQKDTCPKLHIKLRANAETKQDKDISKLEDMKKKKKAYHRQ